MPALHLLRDLLIVFAVSGAAVFLFHRLGLPAIVGFLAAGMAAGPYGLSLIEEIERVEILAEVGVVVLLFTVGLEFSLPRLVGMGRLMLRVGIPQVLVCQLVGVVATWAYFGDVRPAILVGMLLAMSSTAIVFKLLSDRGELSSPHGNISAAVLLFQDLLVVVFMVALPILGSVEGPEPRLPVVQSLAQGFAVVVLLLLAGRYVVPALLFQVVRTQNRELFLIVLVLVCLGSSALTAAMGWSLALGAFLAGLALSESEYATQTLAEVLPFRDTLASLFFVSVGMLLDLRYFVEHFAAIAGVVVAVCALKFAAAGIPTLLAGYPLRIALLTGLALAQVGEFSFILAERALDQGLLGRDEYQKFLAAAVLTMALTPLFMAAGPRFAGRVELLPLLRGWRFGTAPAAREEKLALKNHVIIVGYGLNGRNLARALQAVDIDYVVLELNPDKVRQARADRVPIYYGDCARAAVLGHLGVATARSLAVAISDPPSARRAVQVARQLNPDLHIVVRTRYLSEVDELRRLGANTIIPEEFETSIELFAQVLTEYEVPRNLIMDLIQRVREDHYEVLRDVKLPTSKVELPFDILDKMEIESCQIQRDSPALGRTIVDLKLRAATGATLMAVRRGEELLLNPAPDLRFEVDDIAILIGDRMQVDRALCLLDLGHSTERGEPGTNSAAGG